MLFLGWWKTGQ